MHRGGVRRYGSGGRGGGRGRGGGSRHPAGLTGKEIGLWYAAKGKEGKKKRELTERDVVTMSSYKEEEINQLLDRLQDSEETQSTLTDQHHNRSTNHNDRYRYHHGDRTTNHSDRYRYHHGDRTRQMACQSNVHTADPLRQQRDRHQEFDWRSRNYGNDIGDTSRIQGDSVQQSSDGYGELQHQDVGNDTNQEKMHDSPDSTSSTRKNHSQTEGEFTSRNQSNLEGDALFMFDELGTVDMSAAGLVDDTAARQPSPWSSPFGSSGLQQDHQLDRQLKSELNEKMTSNKKFIEMQAFRIKLPSYSMKEELLDIINKNQVVVVSGETGCGKTTQVAQFILDDAITKDQGSVCRIACTQPRRISAISVAERVANERGEPCGGHSVGYQIRLESKLPRTKGSIIYCTTGVLLRWLVSDGLLSNISHVIIDEIHERDLMSDFLLIIVKDVLPQRPDLKLILMSATLNAQMFSSYFGGCPMAHIPGFTFPVKELYVEDVIEMTRYEVRSSVANNRGANRGPSWKRQSGRKSWAKDRRAEKMAFGEEGDESHETGDEEVKWRQYLDSIRSRYSNSTIQCLENMEFEQIDVNLVVKLITHICSNMEDGAILVFLPGWDDISKLNDGLKNTRVFTPDKYRIIPLHSMMPTSNQREVFDRPPHGVRKIVLATNIAETSITIDDVVFVVDCGKVKEKTYDASRKISCLMPVWISKASSRQRRGRAGRVQSGYCFHIFTELQSRNMIDYQLPEMLRTPLEELCLQIKILKLGMIVEFLSKALEPPTPQAVQNAIDTLKQLNALDGQEALTPLGHHLASLPVDPRIGKMILFGAIFSCLDPILTIASTLGFKEPFVYPLDKKKQADRVRMQLAGDTKSDHLAVLYAFRGWEKAKRHNEDSSYCWENFLSKQTLKMLRDMKVQFARLLCDSGFLDNTNPKDRTANQNSENLKLVKAVLCAGLYPNVVKIDHHAHLNRPPRLYTQQDGKVALHPKSVNVENIIYENNWLIYHQKMKSSKVFIHDTTMIAPYPLLFFGGEISVLVEEGHEIIAVDDFIRFRSPRKIANLVKELRAQLDKLLERKIAQPDLRLAASSSSDESGSSLLHAIIDLITSEESKNWKRRRAMEQNETSP